MKYIEFFFNKVLVKVQYDIVKNLEFISISLVYWWEVQILVYVVFQELKGQESLLGFSNMLIICGYEEVMVMLVFIELLKVIEVEYYLKYQVIVKLWFGIWLYIVNLGLMIKFKQ